jgi:hypothetical protein
LRFYLGAVAYATLLPGTNPSRLKRGRSRGTAINA